MKNPNATISVIHDKRRELKLKPGHYPVKLSLVFKRAPKLYALQIDIGGKLTKLSLTPEDFDLIYDKSCKLAKIKNIREQVNAVEARAEATIKKIRTFNPPFTVEKFEHGFLGEDLDHSFASIAGIILGENYRSRGTLISYKGAYTELNRYRNIHKLNFHDVTPKFLKDYEKHLFRTLKPSRKGKGKVSANTVGSHMRNIRVVVKRAKDMKIIKEENYAFGDYRIPKEKPKKRTMKKADFVTIFNGYHPVPGTLEWEAKNYFLFSYLCNGINPTDIAKLEWEKNVFDDRIEWYRQKTGNRALEKKKITAYISEPMRRIMYTLGNIDSAYVFPILQAGMNDERMDQCISNFINRTNRGLRKIASCLDLLIGDEFTMYYARHGWATEQLIRGTNIKLISDGLGHHNIATTEIYLGSFEDEQVKEMSQGLLSA